MEDQGIQENADVIFATDFSSSNWETEWTDVAPRKALDIVSTDPERKFKPVLGKALRVPEEIRRKRDALAGAPDQVNWCDDGRIDDENTEGAGPGGWLNVFGWYVVGTTIGGNAIVVRVDDPAVYYAGHEWYGGDTTVDFEDFGGSGKGKWISVPFTAEGVRQSLFQLAPSIDKFREMADEIDALLDKID